MVAGEPRYLPTVISDKTTSLAVVNAVVSALFYRERHGVGQSIEVPMFETMVSYVMAEHLFGQVFDPPEGPAGYTRLMSAHRRPYKTKDGFIAILPYMNDHWREFSERAGRADLLEDERFATLASRLENIDATYQEVANTVAARTTAEWVEVLEGSSVPTMVVNSLDGLMEDPHLEATGFWKSMDHPSEGKLRMPGIPMTFSESPGSIRRCPPRLGAHSVEVLEEAGLSRTTIEAMLESGATATAGA
jgi:crotonobetainyl-CoA:carnitine CoA-transferase CaiB-like acyl-CoA transferase